MVPGGLKIGRGHQCDIRVTDISVSRVHALVQLVNNRFVIFDNESKFGTLVKVRGHTTIEASKKAFQVGRTVLTFKMKKYRTSTTAENVGREVVEVDSDEVNLN